MRSRLRRSRSAVFAIACIAALPGGCLLGRDDFDGLNPQQPSLGGSAGTSSANPGGVGANASGGLGGSGSTEAGPDTSLDSTGGSAGPGGMTGSGGSGGVIIPDAGSDADSSDGQPEIDAGRLSTTTPQLIAAPPEDMTMNFGRSVALSGDWAVIGSAHEFSQAGSVYFAQRGSDQTWTIKKKFEWLPKNGTVPPVLDGSMVDFGFSVAMSGSLAAAGGPGRHSHTGFVYYFSLSTAGGWGLVDWLYASDDYFLADAFGFAVAVDASTMVVGAPADENRVGRAYVYEREFDTWTFRNSLSYPTAETQELGTAVAVQGGTVAACAKGSNGSSGAVFIFERSEDRWFFKQKLVPNAEHDALFCSGSLAFDGDTLIAGTESRKGGSTYVFSRTAGVWSETPTHVFLPPRSLLDSPWRFGAGTALCGDNALIGHQGMTGKDSDVIFHRRTPAGWGVLGGLEQLVASAEFSSIACQNSRIAIGDRAANGETGGVWVFDLLP